MQVALQYFIICSRQNRQNSELTKLMIEKKNVLNSIFLSEKEIELEEMKLEIVLKQKIK